MRKTKMSFKDHEFPLHAYEKSGEVKWIFSEASQQNNISAFS